MIVNVLTAFAAAPVPAVSASALKSSSVVLGQAAQATAAVVAPAPMSHEEQPAAPVAMTAITSIDAAETQVCGAVVSDSGEVCPATEAQAAQPIALMEASPPDQVSACGQPCEVSQHAALASVATVLDSSHVNGTTM